MNHPLFKDFTNKSIPNIDMSKYYVRPVKVVLIGLLILVVLIVLSLLMIF